LIADIKREKMRLWKEMKLVLFCVFCSMSSAFAQADTTDSWLEDADAIIIKDAHEFRVKGQTDATYTVHREIQVNNERGKEYGKVYINESVFRKCRNVEGRIKDMEGNVLRELEEDEIFKTTRSLGYDLYDDDKYQHFELSWSSFPYVLEYNYEVDFTTLINWPGWYPEEDHPVLKSTYRLAISDGVGYRTHAVGIDVKPAVQKREGETILTWELENLEARIDETRMPPAVWAQTGVLFAPDEFRVEDSRGSFATWQSLAAWYGSLSADRYLLSDDARHKVRRMVAETPDAFEKVRTLYSYLQKHTRYVAIPLGVGRWQPYSCSSVYENQYGDCKDLSTLMISMLREVQLEAYPVLIKTADNGPLVREFSSNQFNHVITCVPMGADTVWLECTSDILAAGELPYGDEGREVLVVDESGGRIVTTPRSKAESNHWIGKVQGSLDSEGTLALSGIAVASGNAGNWLRGGLQKSKPEERRRMVAGIVSRYAPKLDLASYNIGDLSPHSGKPVRLEFSGTVDGFGVKSRDRLFFNPNLIHRETAGDVPKETERRFPIYYNYAYVQEDSTVIVVPDGYELEAAPDPLDIKTPFGSYKTSQKLQNGVLRHYRMLRIDQNEIETSLYEEYLTFIKTVVNNDKSSFVLVRRLKLD